MEKGTSTPTTRKKPQEPLHRIHYIVFSIKKNKAKTLMCFLFCQIYCFSKTNGKADGLPY